MSASIAQQLQNGLGIRQGSHEKQYAQQSGLNITPSAFNYSPGTIAGVQWGNTTAYSSPFSLFNSWNQQPGNAHGYGTRPGEQSYDEGNIMKGEDTNLVGSKNTMQILGGALGGALTSLVVGRVKGKSASTPMGRMLGLGVVLAGVGAGVAAGSRYDRGEKEARNTSASREGQGSGRSVINWFLGEKR